MASLNPQPARPSGSLARMIQSTFKFHTNFIQHTKLIQSSYIIQNSYNSHTNFIQKIYKNHTIIYCMPFVWKLYFNFSQPEKVSNKMYCFLYEFCMYFVLDLYLFCMNEICMNFDFLLKPTKTLNFRALYISLVWGLYQFIECSVYELCIYIPYKAHWKFIQISVKIHTKYKLYEF